MNFQGSFSRLRGESKSLELKKEMPSNQNIAKAAVAFSNMAGGKIIIGVEDKTGNLKP